VVVADTRLIDSSLVNVQSPISTTSTRCCFATWAVILTGAYGCFLGVLMDFIMSRTGLDLKSRKIVEH
jgi:hypothetical protein